jgi:hypothetical protein
MTNNQNTTNNESEEQGYDVDDYYAEMGFSESDIYYRNQQWARLQHEQQTTPAKRFFSLSDCGL